jgi:2-iminobutanoate/2-iminopropanoate deaminase
MSHSRETVTADPGPPAAGPYSHAVKSNGLLFISGQVHMDPATGDLVGDSPAEKAERCLENLTIIAEAAGAKLENAVRVAVYVTDMGVFAEMNEAYAGYFEQNPPARTTIGVAALPGGAQVEMDAIIAL